VPGCVGCGVFYIAATDRWISATSSLCLCGPVLINCDFKYWRVVSHERLSFLAATPGVSNAGLATRVVHLQRHSEMFGASWRVDEPVG
jgi:hypothetical protein